MQKEFLMAAPTSAIGNLESEHPKSEQYLDITKACLLTKGSAAKIGLITCLYSQDPVVIPIPKAD